MESSSSVFHRSELNMRSLLLNLANSFGCYYICLWYYHCSPHNHSCLVFKDGGYYRAEEEASSGSVRRLYDEYRSQTIPVGEANITVPGLAFRRKAYIEMAELDLQRHAFTDIQRRFYSEARIKVGVFMGFRSGEIELGMPNFPRVNMEMELRNLLFPQDLMINEQIGSLPPLNPIIGIGGSIQQTTSSSSFSIDSPDDYPSSSSQPKHPLLRSNLPTIESTDAAITEAILAVLASSTPSLPTKTVSQTSTTTAPTAFTRYNPQPTTSAGVIHSRKGSRMMKKSLAFYRGLNIRRLQQAQHQQHQLLVPIGSTSIPKPHTSSQLHHMISERKRREKINESFEALRSLVPTAAASGTKKDKATLLATTKDYLILLQSQLSDLTRKNQILETQLNEHLHPLKGKLATDHHHPQDKISGGGSSLRHDKRRLDVQITSVESATTSDDKMVDLGVCLTSMRCSLTDVGIRLLEFLRSSVPEISVMSMEACSQQQQLTSGGRFQYYDQQQHLPHDEPYLQVTRLTLRLKIQGVEWDEAAFLEAVRRVMSDLGQ